MIKKSEPDREDYRYALKGHKIPILTLDTRWHALFQRKGKNSAIRSLEKELNSLLKKQGKLSTDNKEMKKLKKRLMKEIVNNMESAEEGKGSPLQEKKMEASQKLILDINDKMKDADKSLMDLPYQIEQTNRELMIEGMQSCYEELHENADRVKVLTGEINELREKLKVKILEKQDCEMTNEKIYGLMHALVGPGVMEILDQEKGLERKRREVIEEERRAEEEFLRETAVEKIKKTEEKSPKLFQKWKNKRKDENNQTEEAAASEDMELKDPDAPAGTGDRIPKPRRGAVLKSHPADIMTSQNPGAGSRGLPRRGKTPAQKYEEQEKRRENFIRELEAYDHEQEAKRIRERMENKERQGKETDSEASMEELAAIREQERKRRKEEFRRRRELRK